MNNRTHMCGEVTATEAGKSVVLKGWVQRSRNLGGIVFVWLRDRTGIVQIVFDGKAISPELLALAESLHGEYVVEIHGNVHMRAADAVNAKLKTGEIEVMAESAIILNQSKTPPIYIEDETKEQENLRLKYRYLDLRRPVMQNMLMFRHKVIKLLRNYMDDQGFIEVETPMLSKSTPEGARDYLVPARVKPGTFYALPQSPQIYKQLLMLAGLDKYYQVARCFRDEDGRADRQPEFTQFDMEMSFIDPEDIQGVVEGAYAKLFEELMHVDVQLPLKRITWRDAMSRYGSDKPDTRFGMEIADVSETVRGCGFKVFEEALENKQTVCAICAKGAGSLSRKEMDALGEFVKTYHVKGLAWAVVNEDGTLRSSFQKAMQGDSMQKLLDLMEAKAGDAVFVIADKKYVALTAMGQLRLRLGKQLNLIDNTKYDLLWVTEFPLLEWNEEENRFLAM
ncbi:MAG: aspartate--tRNA ligase, partial [Clostridia bacterium]